MESWDVAIVGGGAIGLATGVAVARSGARTLVVEKESQPGLHQSTRNSGVIHAGYNLKPGSEKARYCVEGNRRMRAYCADHAVATRPGGILVVARTEAECATLAELERRARANGVAATMLDSAGIHEREPAASGLAALHAPEAVSVDAAAYVAALARDFTAAGGTLRCGARVVGIDDPTLARLPSGPKGGRGSQDDGGAEAARSQAPDAWVTLDTTAGRIRTRRLVNAGGLFADRLAGPLCPDMRIIPFRGAYAQLVAPRRELVRSHIYAAPDLEFPFLGVHLSHRTDGRVLVGPGAMVAFGREAYTLARWRGRDLRDMLGYRGFWKMLGDPRMRHLVRREVAKSLSLQAVWREAQRLVPGLRPADLTRAYAGNRAQMVDRDGRLVDDIVVRTTGAAVHVLNAVSPGLTCSLPFGEALARQVLEL